ncbi:MAG: hypothetical protein KU37_03205 [Sulfuricurvum sp. PC08-66]|nr:MAG: hypothetical protein KU37_03205 [Sulfuricurvum sp. PC08-66]
MKKMSIENGSYWPWGIILGILAIIALSVGTIVIAVSNPVQMSNDHLDDYHAVDSHINDIHTDNIAFRKHYTMQYMTQAFEANNTQIVYKIENNATKTGVEGAKFQAVLTRPDELQSDITLELESEASGLYTFKAVNLPKLGRWNLFVKVEVEGYKAFERLKLDTRYPQKVEPFGIATRK